MHRSGPWAPKLTPKLTPVYTPPPFIPAPQSQSGGVNFVQCYMSQLLQAGFPPNALNYPTPTYNTSQSPMFNLAQQLNSYTAIEQQVIGICNAVVSDVHNIYGRSSGS